MNATTRAAVVTAFGAPDVFDLAALPVAEAGPGQVRIRVTHSAVNPVDLGTREGRIVPAAHARFPMVLGWDAEGIIDQVGDGVTDLRPGDRVFACVPQPATQAGTHADLIVTARTYVTAAPAGFTDGRAAALGLAGITAYQAIGALDVQAGQKVLINNPVGFVGGLATQIAKARGATVVGVTTEDLAERATAMGVDGLIIAERGADAPLNERDVDAALDLAGGARAHRTFAAVRDNGRYATVLPEWWIGGGVYTPARGITPVLVENDPNPADLRAITVLAEAGTLSVDIADTYPLAAVGDAHRKLAGSRVFGKIIIDHEQDV
ncbi:NADP-dependent oxidoreductase [Micromonospora sp. BQ11]|uniref:NADP-dependent oxidoreductase n=1 Tax=Micromonospora sp. BQ11 TaxID=3452212 RepID=UPI003F8C121B